MSECGDARANEQARQYGVEVCGSLSLSGTLQYYKDASCQHSTIKSNVQTTSAMSELQELKPRLADLEQLVDGAQVLELALRILRSEQHRLGVLGLVELLGNLAMTRALVPLW